MKDKVQNQSYLRSINQRTILGYLRRESMSCTDLAKRMKLSKTAIAKISEELVSFGILVRRESSVQEVGRRPIMLDINPEAGALLVFNLAGRTATGIVADLAGNIICRKGFDINGKIDVTMLEDLISAVKQKHLELAPSLKPLAVCVSTPGKIHPQTGYFILAHQFAGYKDINLRKIFSAHFECELLIHNDIKLALEGERLFGSLLEGVNNALLLHIGYSVGSALMINQKIYGGSNGFAGELTNFSLSALEEEGEPFFPGGSNTFDAISMEGIMRAIRHRTGKNIALDEAVEAYAGGDPSVCEVFERATAIWARTVRNMTEFLDIEAVIISGDITRFGTGFADAIESYVNSSLRHQSIRVFNSELSNESIIFGAINTAITSALNHLLNKLHEK
jgi:predicted NBD/HSP70 family sugar kinase